MEQSWWNSVVEKWNSHGATVWGNSGTVMVEQWNTNSGTVWWNSGTVMVERCGGTVWWTVELWNTNWEQCGGTVEQCNETV